MTSIENSARPINDLIQDKAYENDGRHLGKAVRGSAAAIKELAFDSSNSIVGVQKKLNTGLRKRSVDQVKLSQLANLENSENVSTDKLAGGTHTGQSPFRNG